MKYGNKKIFIEFLRVLAILCVIFNHTGKKGFFLFAEKQNSKLFLLYLFMSIFCKIAVPIFFMISGSLLMQKKESFHYIIFQRIVPTAISIFIGSIIMYVYSVTTHVGFYENSTPGIKDFLIRVYTNHISNPGYLWYLYAYIGILCLLPFLRLAFLNMNKFHAIHITCLFMTVTVIPTIMSGVFNIDYFYYQSTYLTLPIYFFVIGHYIDNIVDIKKWNYKKIVFSIVASFSGMFLSMALTIMKARRLNDWGENSNQEFHNLFIFIIAITLFLSVKKFFETTRENNLNDKILIFLGSAVSGIYLFEGVYRGITYSVYELVYPFFPKIISALIWVLSSFLLGTFATYLIRKIPIIKKYV